MLPATSDGYTETFRSFVNTWECDENAHMNVQFYFRAFQQASEVFALMAGRPNPGAASAIVRHVRYHRELRAAHGYHVRSALLGEGAAAGGVVHLLCDSENGSLAATALDQPGYRTGFPVPVGEAAARPALPRGLPWGPTLPADTAGLLARGLARIVHRSVLRVAETGFDGDMLSEAAISRFTDGVPHSWADLGLSSAWLAANGFGRVAVEMKLTRLEKAEAGRPLRLVTWIPLVEEKTFVIRHQIEDLVTGRVVAAGEVRSLVMDLSTRRAVPVPDFVRQAFAGRTAGA